MFPESVDQQIPDWRKKMPNWMGPPPVDYNAGAPQPIPQANLAPAGEPPPEAPPPVVDASAPPSAGMPPPPVREALTGQNVGNVQPAAPTPPPVKAATPEEDKLRAMYQMGPKTSVLGTLAGLGVKAAAGWASTPGRPPRVNEQRLQDWSERNPMGGGSWKEGVANQGQLAGMEQADTARAQADVARQQATAKNAAELSKLGAETAETKDRGGYYRQLGEADTERQRIAAVTEQNRQKQAQYALKVKGREDSVMAVQPGEQPPPGWQVIDHPDGGKVAVPPSTVKVPAELVPYMPGHRAGDVVGWGEYKEAVKVFREELSKRNIQDNTPEKPEQAKVTFQASVAKVAAENNLPASALSDVKQLSQAIETSKTLTPQEKANARAFLAANTTPAAQGTNTTIRVEGLGNTRENAVIDTKRGNALQYLSSTEINRANQTEPGRYIPAGPGMQSLNKTSLVEDIRGSIHQVRTSLAAIPEFTTSDKALIALALRDRDPKSAMGQLIGGAAGGHMTPAQQEYLIDLTQLHEQAMAMRGVLNTGAGAEDLRAAILRTIPGPGTPNKAYASQQLDKFEQTLNRLSRGIPTVPLRDEGGAAAGPPTVNTGGGRGHPGGEMISVQIPGQPPGKIPASSKAEFLRVHPDAVVQ